MPSWYFLQISERKFDRIIRSVGINKNVFSFIPPSLRNYSEFVAEIWRKDLKIALYGAFRNSKLKGCCRATGHIFCYEK